MEKVLGTKKISPVEKICIVWFRRDLRLLDNPALLHACDYGLPVLPIFIHSADEENTPVGGSASKVWLYHSLVQLKQSLMSIGSDLMIYKGRCAEIWSKLTQTFDVRCICFNEVFEPDGILQTSHVQTICRQKGIEAISFNSNFLLSPADLTNKSGTQFKVFTPFYKQIRSRIDVNEVLPAPESIRKTTKHYADMTIDDLGLLSEQNWWKGVISNWNSGEKGALERVDRLLDDIVERYLSHRDYPAIEGTSKLSPHLHFGEISPGRIISALNSRFESIGGFFADSEVEGFVRQLIWREFANYLLYHFPETTAKPFNKKFVDFPWEPDYELLEQWQGGKTGYPLIDAGMRELWKTGWMHNRVRMNVASFLTKHLLIHWEYGARWFWDTLVDADLANNIFGWQWTAGSGADAAPYFRIFNPALQSQKFDQTGEYIRRWIPELAGLPDKYIHSPHGAPTEVLEKSNIIIGETYPHPIVDHKWARGRALQAYDEVKR